MLHPLHQVIHLIPADLWIGLHRLVVIHIGRSHQSYPLPREGKNRAFIRRVHKGNHFADRQFFLGKYQVGASQLAEASWSPHLSAQFIRPGTRGIDDHFRLHLTGAVARQVVDNRSADLPVRIAQQTFPLVQPACNGITFPGEALFRMGPFNAAREGVALAASSGAWKGIGCAGTVAGSTLAGASASATGTPNDAQTHRACARPMPARKIGAMVVSSGS